MGYYTILKNSQVEIQLGSDYQDNGWSFSEGKAVHEDCNEGYLDNFVFRPVAGVTYRISVEVSGLSNGVVRLGIGGDEQQISSSGTHIVILEAVSTEPLYLWSDANVTIDRLIVYEGLTASNTLLFNEQNNQFVGYRSYTADMLTKFIDEFISFKNGSLWIHDRSEERNTFYGQTYPSEISFYVNIESSRNKDYFSIRLEGNDAWSAKVELPPREGNTRGQASRIKKGRYKFEKGVYYADFLRDMNDPRFDSEMDALMKGAYLQGKYMKVTLTNLNTNHVKLAAVEVDVSIK